MSMHYPTPSNSPHSTHNISPFVENFPASINSESGYGAVDDYDDEEYDDDQIEEFGRKWSIFEKLERKNSCYDYCRACNFKCLLATSMLGLFILFVLTFYDTIFINSDSSQPVGFDFIVVGGGPAGSVMTRSLIDAGARVLLLEAGPATQYAIGGTDIVGGGPITRFDVPLLWSSISMDYYWPDFNVPQVLVAKALGGCGILNGMLYVRAIAHDVRRWGIKGWTWELLLDKYREMERYTSSDNDVDINLASGNYHGTRGPMATTRPKYIDELGPKFVLSAVQQGIDFNSDFNQPNKREGVGYYDFNIANGIRNSAAATMLGPILDNINLVLELEAVVQKVILKPITDIDKHKNEPVDNKGNINYNAIGVEYLQNGLKKLAYLKTTHIPIKDISFSSERSVILTAGAIMTPKLLMLSGIGPAEDLQKRQIPVKVNASAVGRNLQDHPSIGMLFNKDPGVSSSLPSIYSIGKLWSNYIKAVKDKDSDKYGILESPGISSGSFLRSAFVTDDSPDIQLTVYPTLFEPHLIDRYERTKSLNGSYDNKILITITLLQPEARYNLKLSEQLFEKGPEFILPDGRDRYLTDNDIRRLEWGIRQVRKIVSSSPVSQLIREEVSPSLYLNDNQMTSWINENVYPSSHWVGTASMGKVVDESLKVKHVEGLRIADASVIPIITNGPVHATVIAIASLCADIILGKKTMNHTS